MRHSNTGILLSPSDLSTFLGCEHATALDLAGTPSSGETDPQLALIQRKGEEHEQAYLDEIEAAGRSIAEIAFNYNWDASAAATEQAMRDGVDVIYQGVLVDGRWHGFADFLLRVETPSGFGAWSYEALDTKLARSAKPAYILQLLFYNEQIGRIQGRQPDRIHVKLGSGELVSFRPEEFGAYYRRVRQRLEDFVAAPRPTVAWPCEHCEVCGFKAVCDAHWDEVDHLSRVAGMRRDQIEKLIKADIATMAALAAAPADPKAGISAETFGKLRHQAEIQRRGRDGAHHYDVLPPKAGAGVALLPEPSAGDLFFDFEGYPFWDKDGGLEYLWGILDAERTFTPLHAHDHATERAALVEFIDLVHERLRRYPDMHVYHYAAYEITALKRLMGRYGTCEEEIDDLLRRGVFVDLLRVVRNGIRTSRPGYGLKEMEAFLPIVREAEVKDGGTSIVVFDEWIRTRDDKLLAQIDEYNKEDCIATLLLRDWLLEVRREAIERFGEIPPVELDEPRGPKAGEAGRSGLATALFEKGEETASHLLEYHHREARPVWWFVFDRMDKTPEELVEDFDSIGMLELVGEPEVLPKPKRSTLYTFTYPAQESKIRLKQKVRDHAFDRPAVRLVEIDREKRRLVLSRQTQFSNVPLPEALIPGGPLSVDAQKAALERFGRSILAGDHRYPALESIVYRTPFDRPIQTTDINAMKELLRSLDGQHLVIQGPPGSGKTFTSGHLIADLIKQGHKVGVASTSHKAIHRLLDSVEDAATEIGVEYTGLKKASQGNPESQFANDHVSSVESSDDCFAVDLTGGTAWHYSRLHDPQLDYLFIDEAGQVSLADAIAMGTSARNIVLVGDPQQLAQVIQGTHPGGTEKSVLTWLIGDAETIPPDRGLFLESSYRMRPEVCEYISGEFYEGRLRSEPGTLGRDTPLGVGLRFVPVEHENNRQESADEVAAVRRIADELLISGVAAAEILVVSPYNAQVNALTDAMPAGVLVGTVNKFQGQEGDVVIYSMASSSGEDVPRGLEFLLSRNRLNVAISRARCLAYVVASPKLLEVSCSTIDQMRLANALCRFVELAQAR